MARAGLLLLGLCHLALAEPFDRINPTECVASTAEAKITELAKGLNDSSACSAGNACKYQATFAEDFTMEYFDDFKILTNLRAKPPYASVLYPCGTANKLKPAEANIAKLLKPNTTAAYFEVPLTAVAAGDTTAGWALEMLGLQDRVRYASYQTAPCLMKLAAPKNASFGGCGRSFTAAPDPEATPLENFDAEFVFPTLASPADPKKKQIPFTLYSHQSDSSKQWTRSASADPSPLNRVEHLVYMGAFFNKEAAATAKVDEIVKAYQAQASPGGANAPRVAWASKSTFLSGLNGPDGKPLPSETEHYIFSYARYKTAFTQDAGAQMLPLEEVQAAETSGAKATADTASAGAEVKFVPTLYETSAAMYAKIHPLLKKMDILILEDYLPPANITAFMAAWGIKEAEKAMFPFIAKNQLWSTDKDVTDQGDNDWFGEAVLRPDIVLKDLQSVVNPAAHASHIRTFLRNIGKGEQQTMANGGLCKDLTCDAYSEQDPLPVATAAQSGPAPAPGGHGTSGAVALVGMLVTGAFAAAAALVVA